MFQDRLVSDEDRSWFEQLLHTHIDEFECRFEEVVPCQPVLYGDFMFPGSVKTYQLIDDKEKVEVDLFCHICFVLLVNNVTSLNI